MSLHLTLGPMYSGKTTKMIKDYILEKNNSSNKQLLISYEILDIKDGSNRSHSLLTHDNQKIDDVVHTRQLINYDMVSKIQKADVVYVNEAQFFEDLIPFVQLCMHEGKKVYLYGLDGDFERKPMGKILDLIPVCDSMMKLNGKCSMCDTGKSIFSHRITNKKEQIVFDHEEYVPLCRKCYIRENQELVQSSSKSAVISLSRNGTDNFS